MNKLVERVQAAWNAFFFTGYSVASLGGRLAGSHRHCGPFSYPNDFAGAP